MDDSDSDSDDSFVFDVPVEGFEDEVGMLCAVYLEHARAVPLDYCRRPF
jgi:hypothetical protein